MASWTQETIRKYQAFAATYISGYKEAIDCADLALASLIEFAYDNDLPLELKYYSGGWKSYKSADYPKKADFKSVVLVNMGALSVIDNTSPIEASDAGAGDLIMTKWSNTLGHTRVIYSIVPVTLPNGKIDHDVTWYQGNLPAVVPERKTARFSAIENVYDGKPRRWRFEKFK